MARPKTAQVALHAAAAVLYAAGQVRTDTSLGELERKIAAHDVWIKAYRTASQTTAGSVEAVRAAIKRAHPRGQRAALLWERVLVDIERPPSDPLHLPVDASVRDVVRTQLRQEVQTKDPVFAAFRVVLTAAESADTPAARASKLRDAAAQLPPLLPEVGPVVDEQDRASRTSRLSRIAGAYGQLFDAAVGDTGPISDELVAIAEDAVRGGYDAWRWVRELQKPRILFGQRRNGPRRVSWHAGNVWVSAVAVLAVVRGVPAEQIVEHTRTWTTQHLGVGPQQVSAGDVLAEAAEVLVRLGRRTEAAAALEAAWNSGESNRAWEALLDLAITLAALMFAHGDRAGAAAVLSDGVRGQLDADYGEDADGEWNGPQVDYSLYRLLRAALADPHTAAAAARRSWAALVGADSGRRSSWAVTGMLVEVLGSTGDWEQAAWMAELAPIVLRAPTTVAEQQVAAHLSEMCSTDQVPPAADAGPRMDMLVEDLIAIIMRSPNAATLEQEALLRGLADVIAAARRSAWRRQADAA